MDLYVWWSCEPTFVYDLSYLSRAARLSDVLTSGAMSVNEDTLRKVLTELQQQAVSSARNLNATRTLQTAKERERRLVQLTRAELSTLDEAKGERVYKGVGKMFVLEDLNATLSELRKKEKDATDDISALGKKVKVIGSRDKKISALAERSVQYLENEQAQAQAGLKEIFEHQRRQ